MMHHNDVVFFFLVDFEHAMLEGVLCHFGYWNWMDGVTFYNLGGLVFFL